MEQQARDLRETHHHVLRWFNTVNLGTYRRCSGILHGLGQGAFGYLLSPRLALNVDESYD